MRWPNRAVVMMLVVSGCISPDRVRCEDGSFCPSGTRCGEPTGCIAPGDCGDGRVQGAEVCDDGNIAGGDGCSADCASTEVCRNTVVDPGEQCDDGNSRSHDGCSSACLTETPRWREIVDATPPTQRVESAAAWDPDRGRAILFGGVGAGTQTRSDTWLWDGTEWSMVTPSPRPPGLGGHAMAADLAGRVVLVGGYTGFNMVYVTPAITWVWDGIGWSELLGASPPGNHGHSAAAGPLPGQIVMTAGERSVDYLRDTWLWSNGGWTAARDDNAPTAPRRYSSMAHDPIAGMTIVAGGLIDFEGYTWRDPQAGWQQEIPGISRSRHTVVYDSARQRVVSFGGQLAGSGITVADPRELDGFWRTIMTVDPSPPPRYSGVGFHDPIRHGVVVFGGQSDQGLLNDTWMLRWESATPDDACDGSDADLDGAIGCEDPDCWARCDPRCVPGAMQCDPDRPRCGDGTCNSFLEDKALCPSDC